MHKSFRSTVETFTKLDIAKASLSNSSVDLLLLLSGISMLCFQIRLIRNSRAGELQITGTAVLRGGLKNGMGTTFAETVCRTASTVISTFSVLPSVACSRLLTASAMCFFRLVDRIV